jgi:hypothetical protein
LRRTNLERVRLARPAQRPAGQLQGLLRYFRPIGAEQLRLGEDGLGRLFFQIWRVAVFPQDSLYQDFDFGAGALAHRPIDGHALSDLGDQLGSDDVPSLKEE